MKPKILFKDSANEDCFEGDTIYAVFTNLSVCRIEEIPAETVYEDMAVCKALYFVGLSKGFYKCKDKAEACLKLNTSPKSTNSIAGLMSSLFGSQDEK